MRRRKVLLPLKLMIAVFGLIPVGAGLAGIALGGAMVDGTSLPISLDSHYRYLSGLLLAIGLGFWSTIPAIERQGARFRLLTLLVVVGGLGRLYGVATQGVPSHPMLGGLAMELVVTPLLCLWQARIASSR